MVGFVNATVQRATVGDKSTTTHCASKLEKKKKMCRTEKETSQNSQPFHYYFLLIQIKIKINTHNFDSCFFVYPLGCGVRKVADNSIKFSNNLFYFNPGHIMGWV